MTTGTPPAAPDPAGTSRDGEPHDAPLARRTFLTGGLAAIGGAAIGGALAAGTPPADDATTPATAGAVGAATVPFRGRHQAGVATPPPAHATFLALDLAPGTDRDALRRLMQVWTDDAERVTSGRPSLADTEPELARTPASLTVTVGFGPGVFVAAGLEPERPTWLRPLPAFAVDLLEPAWSGGDLVLQVCADDPTTVAHAVRVLVKGASSFAAVRWVQRGFRNAAGALPAGTTMRNLMGQVDGTANPRLGTEDAGTPDDDVVWHRDGAHPTWLAGGTSLVIRRISMDLDGWDLLDRPAREAVIGRRLDTGAPLTGVDEHDVPDLDAVDARGLPVIAPFAHIRRARARTPQERVLRRVYSYDESPPAGRRTDSGLIFATYQADVARQFVPIQARLAELDLLNQWTTPVGSAVFAVPGGARDGEYLAERLLGG